MIGIRIPDFCHGQFPPSPSSRLLQLSRKRREEGTAKKQDAGEPLGVTAEAAMAAWPEQAWSAGSSPQLKAFLLHVEWIWICLVQTVFVFQAPTPASELTRQQLGQVSFSGKSDSHPRDQAGSTKFADFA